MYEYLPLFWVDYPDKLHKRKNGTSTIACTIQFIWNKRKNTQSMTVYFNTVIKKEKSDTINLYKESRDAKVTITQRIKATILSKSSPINK